MDLLASVAAVSSGLLVLFVAVLVMLAVFRQEGSSKPLLLDQALRRQGDDVAYRAISSGSHDFAVAVQRCLACNEAAQCRAWLSSGARDGYQHFCPNAGFIERMKR
ncbi:MAG TPA: DUF6455 family protein [Burkholderiales bacterium]|jgi:ribosomal protein S12 methylthiotransferase accessory factor YcaO